ncbi:competence pheromone ComX, partial [Bacillus sp. SIMBA_005]
MQEIVGYLTKNPEVLNKVIEGNASLIGVSQDQTDCVIN